MRENSKLEFKEDLTNSFLKTVSAFSNYDGGQIIFGVDDAGNVVGVKDSKEFTLAIENKVNDNISPMPDYSLQINPDQTITLDVHEGPNKPYFYKSKAYRRHDTATIEVDTQELTRLILEGKHLTYDALKADRQDLTFNKLGTRIIAKTGISTFNQDTLKTLNLYSDEQGFNNAAAILADENTFPGIDIARFGENISIILQRKTIQNRSALEAYEEALEFFRLFYTYEVISGFTRETVETIPDEAFREAIANALVHRLWDVQAQIRVSMFEDRVEITSPGGLPKGVNEADYLKGNLSVLRNPILANVFFRLNLIEIFGTGIMRIKEAYHSSATKPKFEVTENVIKITLPVVKDKSGLTDDEAIVFAALSSSQPKSISEIIPETGFGRSKVRKILNDLTEQGIAAMEGSQRGTKYRLK